MDEKQSILNDRIHGLDGCVSRRINTPANAATNVALYSFPWTLHKSFWLWALFLFLAIAFVLFVRPEPFTRDDALRHIRIAEHYRERGIDSIGGWGDYFFFGYFTKYNSDPWFLAHLLYTPFTVLDNDIIGLKIATLAWIFLIFLSFIPFLRLYRPGPEVQSLFLLLLFAGSRVFSSRLLFGRPLMLSIALLLLTYYLVLRERYVLLLPLFVIAVLLSHHFVFLLPVCFIGCLLRFLQKKYRAGFHCLSFTILGVFIGFILHPSSREYMRFLLDVFFKAGFSKHLGTGREFYMGITNMDTGFWIPFVTAPLVFAWLHYRRELRLLWQSKSDLWCTITIALLYFLMYVLWVRSIDYLWPILVVLLLQILTLTTALRETVRHFLKQPVFFRSSLQWRHLIIAYFLITFISVHAAHLLRGDERSLSRFSAIEVVPAGSRVLNIDWDVFSPLFFLNDRVFYARGMDSLLDYGYDLEAARLIDAGIERWYWKTSLEQYGFIGMWQDAWRWMRDTSGDWHQRENMSLDAAQWLSDVRETFRADYLVLRNDFHPKLIERLRKLPDLPIFAENDRITIFAF